MPASAVALAAAAIAVRAAAAPAPVPVCHNGFLILRVRTAAWGMSAQQRAVIIQQRFSNLISAALEAQAKEKPIPRPAAARLNGDWVVMARGSVLVTVTALDAAANRTSPGPLARIWAERFGAALVLATFGERGRWAGGTPAGCMAGCCRAGRCRHTGQPCPRMRAGKCPKMRAGQCPCGRGGQCERMKSGRCPRMGGRCPRMKVGQCKQMPRCRRCPRMQGRPCPMRGTGRCGKGHTGRCRHMRRMMPGR